MTLHELTLPGEPPPSFFCYSDYCEAEITEAKREDADTYEEWHLALDRGQESITQYLEAYNKEEHRDTCPFRDLPPSVHLWCRAQESEPDALQEELRLLEEARQF
ncbi:hypothetical protein [Nonomuraea sp. NPDC002799]